MDFGLLLMGEFSIGPFGRLFQGVPRGGGISRLMSKSLSWLPCLF